ncbi:MliC family protein [Frateuria terrea]|uniref:Membrane-bound inhibitor of C-type lysozyme n=1 Tax=Frateuria terrea TaxID=529704 RepID=A0A1H6YMU5_9GAMM|nr:MliC family protein [Frateuria terrea]SEJ42643.1 Membrane-bound inhibitor of C-type lysozyme [Frateuria terrea]SFP73116.1 Membrane-bound inhibitor of C-type lysozyme [Frateuria terrea]
MRPCLVSVPILVAATLLAACQPTRASPPRRAYHCADGRVVQAGYEGTDRAVLAVDGATHRLTIALSASGARYVGDGWQWWTKGMHDAWLAPLQPGENIASAPGVACQAQGGP